MKSTDVTTEMLEDPICGIRAYVTATGKQMPHKPSRLREFFDATHHCKRIEIDFARPLREQVDQATWMDIYKSDRWEIAESLKDFDCGLQDLKVLEYEVEINTDPVLRDAKTAEKAQWDADVAAFEETWQTWYASYELWVEIVKANVDVKVLKHAIDFLHLEIEHKAPHQRNG